MINYFIKRLLQGILTFIMISILSFAIFQATPGDPAYSIYGADSQQLTDDERERINQIFHYNQSFIQKYVSWASEAVNGHLGYSYVQGQPVTKIIAESLPNTLLLFFPAIIIITLVAIFLGIKAGRNEGSIWDRSLTFFSITIGSIPSFWFGIVCILLFSVKLKWLPSSGTHDIMHGGWKLSDIQYLIMPLFVLCFSHIGMYARFLQEKIKEESKQHYVQVATINGADERFINLGILKNAISPFINYIGVTIPGFFGGSIIIESLFNWSGLGLLSVQSILTRDYPLLMGSILVTGIVVFVAVFITDVISILLNPQLRRGYPH